MHSAIRAIHELQRSFVESFGRTDVVAVPKPIVASFVMSPVERSGYYPFRLAVVLPPWGIPELSAAYGSVRRMSDAAKRALSLRRAYFRINNLAIPVNYLKKADLRVKLPAEQVMRSFGIPPHVAAGNVPETAGVVALLKDNPLWSVARNVILTVPNPHAPQRYRRRFGQVLFEFDALASDGKHVFPVEVKGVGPGTEARWQEILVHKAMSMLPATEYLLQLLDMNVSRLRAHFVVVGDEERSTKLAEAALRTLRPPMTDHVNYGAEHPFSRLWTHAVWPHRGTLLRRTFR